MSGVDPWAISANAINKPALVFSTSDPHHIGGSIRAFLYCLGSTDDVEPQEQRRHIVGQFRTVGRVVDGNELSTASASYPNVPISCPQVAQEQGDVLSLK